MSFGNPKPNFQQTIKVVDNHEGQQEKTNETYKMKSPTVIVQKSSVSHIQKAGQLAGTIVKKWTKLWIDSKNYKNIIWQSQIIQLVCQLGWRSHDRGPSGIGIGMGDIATVSSVHKEKQATKNRPERKL